MVLNTYVVAAVLLVSSAGWRPTHREADPPGPEAAPLGLLEIDGAGIDRGLVRIGSEASRTVRLTNRSRHPLRLTVLGTSCHCLQHRLAASQLAPGERTEIELTILVLGGFGRQDHFLVLEAEEQTSSPAREEVIKVGISFTPERTYEYLPRQFVGTTRVGTPASWDVFVARKSPGDLVVRDPATDMDGLTAEGPLPVAENPTVQRVALRGVWTAPGIRTGWVTFKTNSAEQPVGSVQAAVRILPAWVATPIGILARVPNDTMRHEDVVLRPVVPNAPVPARLDLVQCDPPEALKCVLNGPDAAGYFSVSVDFDPSLVPPHRIAGRAIIRVLDDDANLILEVPFVWYRDRQ